MNVDLLIKGLAQAGKEPLAFVAYTILIIAIFSVAWKESRIKIIAKSLKDLPESERLEALKLEYNLQPRDGMDTTSFLILEKRRHYFLLAMTIIAMIVIIGSLGIYRYIQLDKISTFNSTMKLAYDALARGTTSADDNRFANAIGRMEESVNLNPSYQGYMLLADIYDESGNTGAALAASRKAAQLDPDNPSPEMYIGMFLKDLGRFNEAEKHLRAAIRKFDATGLRDAELRVALLVNLGNVYYERADAASGEERVRLAKIALSDFYRPALDLFDEVKDERYKANALGNIANAFRLNKDFRKAEYYMLQSIAKKENIYHSDPAYRSIGIGYFNLSDV